MMIWERGLHFFIIARAFFWHSWFLIQHVWVCWICNLVYDSKDGRNNFKKQIYKQSDNNPNSLTIISKLKKKNKQENCMMIHILVKHIDNKMTQIHWNIIDSPKIQFRLQETKKKFPFYKRFFFITQKRLSWSVRESTLSRVYSQRTKHNRYIYHSVGFDPTHWCWTECCKQQLVVEITAGS